MEITDDRLRLDDLLAVELHQYPQHAVGRRVLRTEVDLHFLDVKEWGLRTAHALSPFSTFFAGFFSGMTGGPPPSG